MNLGHRTRIAFLPQALALMVLCTTLAASASDLAAPRTGTPPNPATTQVGVPMSNFGLDDYDVVTITGYDFDPFRLSGAVTGLNDDQNGFSWATGGTNKLFIGSVPVPAGAVIDFIGLRYCDSTATSGFTAVLYDIRADGTFTTINSTQHPDTSCTTMFNPLPLGYNWDTNSGHSLDIYLFQIGNDVGGEVKFRGAEVWYKRKVSPAPGVNTFSDVLPADGAFQFIEAFVNAGITVGCDAGPPARYCPDDFVTRRQMAVFFAKALGLHFTQ